MSADVIFPAKLVFVTGAPRSGTTITHALLCTAPGASPYTPEISFFRFVVQAYWVGVSNWDVHTNGFFPDVEAFRKLMAEAARHILLGMWRGLGEPPILCLKDPMLTPYVTSLADLLPEARFVTVVRHPYDVVRSRQEVHAKAGLGEFGADEVRAVAEEYRDAYWGLLGYNFGRRSVIFRYEDLDTAKVRNRLLELLEVPEFDEDRLWVTPNGQKRDFSGLEAYPTHSPKYSGPIDLAPRLDSLKAEWQEIIAPICHMVMLRMDYS